MTKLLEYLEVALHITTIICLVAIAISLILFIYRVITGPSNPDRAMALDVIGVCLIAIAALTSILVITTKLTVVILLIVIFSFIGTLALALYLEMGDLIERDDELFNLSFYLYINYIILINRRILYFFECYRYYQIPSCFYASTCCDKSTNTWNCEYINCNVSLFICCT